MSMVINNRIKLSINKISRFINSSWSCNKIFKLQNSTAPKNDSSLAESGKRDLKDAQEKKPQKPPFVKNLFIDKFDKEILTYPEFSSRDRYDMVHSINLSLKDFMESEVDSKEIDQNSAISSPVLKSMKELGLYGLQVPEKYGGLGLNVSECSRVMEEISCDSSIAEVVVGHNHIATNILVTYGSEAQKMKYLPRLASGEWTAALCLNEAECGNDVAAFTTTTIPNVDETFFTLNGTKTPVSNGSTADLFFVVSKFKYGNQVDDPSFKKVCVLLVERNSEGVSCGENISKLGIKGCPTCSVKFNQVLVPKENLLGSVEKSFEILFSMFDAHRFSYGPRCTGILKKFLKQSIERVTNSYRFGQPMDNFSLVSSYLTQLAVDIYALESMTYLTAGLWDTYEDQDCSLESAIVKIFSTEKALEHISKCMQIFGPNTYLTGSSLDLILRNLREPIASEDFCGSSTIFIAILGLEYAGLNMYNDVKILRNLYMYPKHLFREIYSSFFKPKLYLRLYEHLHPSVKKSADVLEISSMEFGRAVRNFLARSGKDCVLPENQINMYRLANAAIDLYALTAVLGRASRSYCIGVHNSTHEMELARQFSLFAKRRIKFNLDGMYPFMDHEDLVSKKIFDSMIEKRQYAAESPISKVFW